jgi:hypothetical protein
MTTPAKPLSPRRPVYTLLIVIAAAIAAARIVSVTRMPTATFADNDRSRWATVRALVDDGTYAIGRRLPGKGPDGKPIDAGIVSQEGWKTIDKVLRPDTQEFYSSKPPLLAKLAAAEYWLLKELFGWSITRDPWRVVPVILMTLNWIPLVLYLVLLAGLVERYGATDWGRLFVMTAACFATLLTVFMPTFNNHTIATCSALFAIHPLMRIWYENERRPGLFVAAGFFAGFTAANELPAAAFLAAVFCLLYYRFPLHTLLFFVPGAILPIAEFLWTNYQAIGRWSPAYSEFGTSWYEYEGSFWASEPGEAKHGIDWAYQTEGSFAYAFHVLFGHHGVFSLSPIYFLSAAGAIGALLAGRRKAPPSPPTPLPGGARGAEVSSAGGRAEEDYPTEQGGAEFPSKAAPNLKMVSALTLLLSAAIIGFYTFGVNERNRNYGGWTNGLRWLMWLTPLWLLTMLPAADWLSSRRWGRGLAYAFLAISIFSASYVPWNPWRHPWLYDLLESNGWIRY